MALRLAEGLCRAELHQHIPQGHGAPSPAVRGLVLTPRDQNVPSDPASRYPRQSAPV